MWTCKQLKQLAKNVLHNCYGASLGVISLSYLVNIVVSSAVFCLSFLLFAGALARNSGRDAIFVSLLPTAMTLVSSIFLGNPLSARVQLYTVLGEHLPKTR